MSWNDFNDAEEQRDFDAMPKGTLVKVRMMIRPGGYDDPSQGWTGGYAKLNEDTGSICLDAEFVVVDGQYARRKFWMMIGLHSDSGPTWSKMGRTLIKGILNSSRGIDPKDTSPQAQQARRIQGFHDLDGVEFVAKLGVEKDQNGDNKNTIGIAVAPDHKNYASLMSGGQALGQVPTAGAPVQEQGYQPSTQQLQPQQQSAGNTQPAPSGRPNWAQ